MSDDFVRDLEHELTAAARRRAAAPPRRLLPALAPRRLLPAVALGAIAAALVTVVAVLARGDAEQRAPQPPAGGSVLPGCARPSDALAARLPLLAGRRAPLPPAGVAVLRDWEWNFSAIATAAAAPWGERDGIAFWVVPVVSKDAGGDCAPADGACLVALPEGGKPDAHCLAPLEGNIRWSPFPGGRTLVLGFAENGAAGVNVVSGTHEALVPARDGVLAGLVPFRVGSPPHLQVVRSTAPVVTVVDAASGDAAETVQRRLERAGYEADPRIVDGVTRQEPTVVWWSDRDDFRDATALAERLGADDVRMIDRQAPRPVFEAQGDLVVQVGTNTR